LIIPRICGGWWTPQSLLLTLLMYALVAVTCISFYRAFRVWRNSLASKYEQQCQKLLVAFNLQLCDGNSSTAATVPAVASASSTDNRIVSSSSSGAGVAGKDIGYHLTFLRRMPRRLVAFLEAYREEYRARRHLLQSGRQKED